MVRIVLFNDTIQANFSNFRELFIRKVSVCNVKVTKFIALVNFIGKYMVFRP